MTSHFKATPGSAEYLPSLIAYFSSKYPGSFDPQLFTAIFVCLVAGEKNLVIRTAEDDISRVTNAAINILVTLFGLPTQRVQGRQIHEPAAFLRSLFLIPPSSSSISHLIPSLSPIRRKILTDQTIHGILLLDRLRSSSVHGQPFVLPAGPVRNLHLLQHPAHSDDASTRTLRPQSGHGFHIPVPPRTPESVTTELPRNISNVSYTSQGRMSDDSPTRHTIRKPPVLRNESSSSRVPKLPHALVISKLERTPFRTQCALSEMLRTRRIILEDESDTDEEDAVVSIHEKNNPTSRRGDQGTVWNLPSGFLVVYVCGLGDGRQLPPIPTFLLDAFAFHATILLDGATYNTPPGTLRLVTPQISVDEIERLHVLCERAHISTYLQTYIANILTATRHHPSLKGSLISAHCSRDLEDFTRASRVIFGSAKSAPGEGNPTEPLDCSEVDVARVMGGVLGHRVSARLQRDGPLGSMVRTAVRTGRAAKGDEEVVTRESVYHILTEILGKV